MSRDTIMEDSDTSVSNTDAIIYGASYISGRTESLISGPNIPNSSSTSEDEYQQQQISTAAAGGCCGTDDTSIVSSSASSNWFTDNNNNNNKQSDEREIRFELDLSLNVGGQVKEQAWDNAVVVDLRNFLVQQTEAMKEVCTYFTKDVDQWIHGMNPQYIVRCHYYPGNLMELGFYQTCPDFKLAHSIANQAILQAFADSDRVHVIDFSFNRLLLQWRTLMLSLTFRPGGPLAFRLTGISLSSKFDNTTVALQQIGYKLAQFAEEIGLEFEFRSIVVNPLADDDIDAKILNIRPSNVEAMAVHSVFEVHHLLSRPGPIEKLFNSVRQMQPKVVTIIEQEMNGQKNCFARCIG